VTTSTKTHRQKEDSCDVLGEGHPNHREQPVWQEWRGRSEVRGQETREGRLSSQACDLEITKTENEERKKLQILGK
jgi:hypothetical protein